MIQKSCPKKMNNEGQDAFGELSSLVETLTTSGSQSLDQGLFKRVKNICKSSDENVRHLYKSSTKSSQGLMCFVNF